jgi:hypothetical protein
MCVLTYLKNFIIKMPFVNDAQRRACYAKKDPRWDCQKWDSYFKFCGAKCKDGYPCERKCKTKKCWQHS